MQRASSLKHAAEHTAGGGGGLKAGIVQPEAHVPSAKSAPEAAARAASQTVALPVVAVVATAAPPPPPAPAPPPPPPVAGSMVLRASIAGVLVHPTAQRLPSGPLLAAISPRQVV